MLKRLRLKAGFASRPRTAVGRDNWNRRRGLTQGGTAMLVLSRKLGERILVPHCELSVTG